MAFYRVTFTPLPLMFVVMDTVTLCLYVFAGMLGLDLLFCFSARQNMRYLNQKLSSEIDIVRSVKFIFSCLVIVDHTGGVFGAAPLWNLEQLESVSRSSSVSSGYLIQVKERMKSSMHEG